MQARVIILKYGGPCVVCDKRIRAGEAALWQKGAGIAHPVHFSEEEKKRDGVLTPFKEEKKS